MGIIFNNNWENILKGNGPFNKLVSHKPCFKDGLNFFGHRNDQITPHYDTELMMLSNHFRSNESLPPGRFCGDEELPNGGFRGDEELPSGGFRGDEELPSGGFRGDEELPSGNSDGNEGLPSGGGIPVRRKRSRPATSVHN